MIFWATDAQMAWFLKELIWDGTIWASVNFPSRRIFGLWIDLELGPSQIDSAHRVTLILQVLAVLGN